MDRPDHAVFWVQCVAPRLDEIVKIRPIQVWCSVHPFLLLLAPAFRHRKVEGDRDFHPAVRLHLETQLITESTVLEDAWTLLPLVTLRHPRLGYRNDGEIKRH